MRTFVISDIHGFGNVYYSIMNYLDNISKNEEIELFINGDLIDYGLESVDILLDLKNRIESGTFPITYLGGDHELLMYKVFKNRKKGLEVSPMDGWFMNGGYITDDNLHERLDDEEINEVVDFISNLKIYHKFEERINNKRIVLTHAACLDDIEDTCDIRIRNDNDFISYAVSTKKYNIRNISGFSYIDPYKNMIGHPSYFTIIGHTPNNNPLGFDYYQDGNYLNIDGGCSCYVSGNFKYDHFPLVEICGNYFKILTFNSNNEIICGNYFDGNRTFSYTTLDMEEARKYLDRSVKIKKLSMNSSGIVEYID